MVEVTGQIYSSTKKLIADIPLKVMAKAEEHMEKGIKFLVRNRIEDARKQFQKALKRIPNYYVALNNLAVSYFYEGEFDKAIHYAKRALETDPDNLFSYVLLIESYYSLRNKEEAQRAVKKAIELINRYTYSDAYLSKLVEALVFIGEDNKAYEIFKRFKKKLQDSKNATISAGVAAANIGKLKDAYNLLRSVSGGEGYIADYAHLIKYALDKKLQLPRLGIIIFTSFTKNIDDLLVNVSRDYVIGRFLALVVKNRNQPKYDKDAISFLGVTRDTKVYRFLKALLRDKKTTIELKKVIIWVLSQVGYLKEGEKIEIAQEGGVASIKIEKVTQEQIQEELENLKETTSMLLKEEKIDEAEHKIREFLQHHPFEEEAMILLAHILVEKNYLNEAEKMLEKALKIKDNPDTRFLLGKLYFRRGKLRKARRLLLNINANEVNAKNKEELLELIKNFRSTKKVSQNSKIK